MRALRERLSARASPTLLGVASNGGWLMAGSALKMAVGFITAVWLTRYLGPESFGVYSYVIAVVMILVSVSSIGMAGLVTRELVERPDDRNRILGSALALRVFGSAVATLLLVGLALLLHADPDLRFAIVVFGVVLLVQPLEVTALFYEARTESRYVVWVQMVAAAIYVAVVLTFIALDLSVFWFLAARVGEVFIVQLGALFVYARQGHRPSDWRPQGRRIRRLAREAWPLALSSVGAVLYLRIDQVMLGRMTSSHEVGVYAAAARLSEVWYFVPTLIVASAFPQLLRLRLAERDRYRTRLQQLIDVLAWLGLLVAVAVAIAAPWLVGWLYGPAYAGSDDILRVHIWAGVFVFMRAAFSKWLVAERLLMYSLATQGAGAVINIAANMALIPAWGGIGAAWATLVSYAMASYFALWFFPATRPAAKMMTRAFVAPVRYLRGGVASA